MPSPKCALFPKNFVKERENLGSREARWLKQLARLNADIAANVQVQVRAIVLEQEFMQLCRYWRSVHICYHGRVQRALFYLKESFLFHLLSASVCMESGSQEQELTPNNDHNDCDCERRHRLRNQAFCGH